MQHGRAWDHMKPLTTAGDLEGLGACPLPRTGLPMVMGAAGWGCPWPLPTLRDQDLVGGAGGCEDHPWRLGCRARRGQLPSSWGHLGSVDGCSGGSRAPGLGGGRRCDGCASLLAPLLEKLQGQAVAREDSSVPQPPSHPTSRLSCGGYGGGHVSPSCFRLRSATEA